MSVLSRYIITAITKTYIYIYVCVYNIIKRGKKNNYKTTGEKNCTNNALHFVRYTDIVYSIYIVYSIRDTYKYIKNKLIQSIHHGHGQRSPLSD